MKRIGMVAVGVFVALCVVTYATPVRTMDSVGGGAADWDDLDGINGAVEASADGTFGNPAGGLEIHATGTPGVGYNAPAGPPLSFEFEGNPTDAITGGANDDWATAIGLGGDGGHMEIDFYDDSGLAGLSVYFENGTSRWTYDVVLFGDAGATGWSTYAFSMDSSGTGWGHSGGAGTWAADLAQVDVLGFIVTYDPDAGPQLLGLDNFILDDEPLGVPEPGTYVMLGSALISLGITFRRRLEDVVAMLKEKLAA